MEQKADTNEKVGDSTEQGKPRAGTLAKAVEITVYLLAIGMMVLLSLSATDKAYHVAKFQEELKKAPFIPEWSAWAVAIGVIAASFASSLLLLLGFWKPRWMRIGWWLASVLMLGFTLYMAAIMTIAPYRPCICIGLDEKLGLGWRAHLLLNGVLLSASWAATLLSYVHKRFVATSEATPGL